MTPEDRQRFLMETENSVRQFAALIASRMAGSTGIPKPPEIIVTETETETERFGLKLDPKDESSSAGPGASHTTPPATCPDTVIVTFHDVVFDCGCVLRPIGSGDLTDVGLFNDIPITLSSVDPDPACQLCMYEWSSGDAAVHARLYANTDCTSLTSEGDVVFSGNIVLWKDLAGLWHLRLDFFSNMPLVFYGTSTSLSLPFDNLISCSYSLVLWPNPDCTFDFYDSVGAHGGTATIS